MKIHLNNGFINSHRKDLRHNIENIDNSSIFGYNSKVEWEVVMSAASFSLSNLRPYFLFCRFYLRLVDYKYKWGCLCISR